jgi:DNA uptake protein ComE-like DNA-binding protein
MRGWLIVATLCFAAPPIAAAEPEPVDLNTAKYEELAALPGVGDAFAPRIIEGRPYTATTQLLTRRIVPRATYQAIRHRVGIGHEPDRLAVNVRTPRRAS